MPAETIFSLARRKVWVTGHRGLVGSALMRRLASEQCEILTTTRQQLDLRRQADVELWFEAQRPEVVFLAAARVGGILANVTCPAEALYENLMIEANVIHAAHQYDVAKLVFVGSNCVYPKLAPQPLTEDAMLTGALEPTTEWYAVAKIAGVKLAEAYRKQHGRDFISAMPANLYGPGDNFDLAGGHVLPALIRKAHEAKVGGQESLPVWGSGSPRREFLHVDDCADALVHLAKTYSDSGFVNLGSGNDLSILDLTRLVVDVVGFSGEIVLDPSKPDGTPRKLMSAEKLKGLEWVPKIALRDGVADTYAWFVANKA